MTADTPEDKGSVAEARPAPPPVPPPVPPAAEPPPQRLDLERALAEVERLTLDAKQHAVTKSTAERQAADLSMLRKFQEKAHSELDRLRSEKAILSAEKEQMQKQVADAVTHRRKREQAEADMERLKLEVKRLESDKAALEKKLAGAEALRAAHEQALAEVEQLKRRVQELEASPGSSREDASGDLFPQPPTPRVPFGSVLPETQAMPPYEPDAAAVPRGGPAPETLPMPGVGTAAPVERKSEPPAATKNDGAGRIRYTCIGCSRKLGAPADFAGTYGTCRFCGHRMKVPAQSTR